ncbi:glycosyltransferase family 4 protein [Chitinibacter fontanus]|uniref:Glycosyltransferase family 4 protein n=1 Tax=Chitinibacter fontanus TaxID=1737446 RepID=A0A7D5VB93_9NEIS|nr:glycosyltransferase family 4 protein [Chitinibacter fontanus]QLI82554.1 glycosyltransferase family 4 protein [Chitinibacter fontanus]
MTHIVMIGTDWSAFGGITAVIKSYKDGGLFDKWPIRFLATYQNDRLINKLLMALRAYIVLFFWLVTRQVAVVHAHSASRASFWRKSGLLCLALFFGVKTIFHLHSGEFPVFYHRECKPWQKRYIRWILRQVDQVIVLTSSWEETVLTIEPNCRVYALPNPIMASKFEATPIPFRVLFLGRLREKKGVYDLIASWKSIVDKYPLAQLVLAGDGDQNPFWDLAIELGIERQIEMPGWIAGGDKVLALRTADIFVLPSYFEGLPVCILEAMAQGFL